MASDDQLTRFLALSATLTGYDTFRLRGTGQSEPYRDTVTRVVGDEILERLLERFDAVAAGDAGEDLDRRLRVEILSDPCLGPVARNVVKLWYGGTWFELPAAWREAYGSSPDDTTFVVSAASYTEALLYPTVGANPPGAKAPGYGTWVAPPRIPES